MITKISLTQNNAKAYEVLPLSPTQSFFTLVKEAKAEAEQLTRISNFADYVTHNPNVDAKETIMKFFPDHKFNQFNVKQRTKKWTIYFVGNAYIHDTTK